VSRPSPQPSPASGRGRGTLTPTVEAARDQSEVASLRSQIATLPREAPEIPACGVHGTRRAHARRILDIPVTFLSVRKPDQCRYSRTMSPRRWPICTAEFEILMSQNATSSWGGRRKRPLAFTEHGAIMAALHRGQSRLSSHRGNSMVMFAREGLTVGSCGLSDATGSKHSVKGIRMHDVGSKTGWQRSRQPHGRHPMRSSAATARRASLPAIQSFSTSKAMTIGWKLPWGTRHQWSL